jgi:hypothetical protein
MRTDCFVPDDKMGPPSATVSYEAMTTRSNMSGVVGDQPARTNRKIGAETEVDWLVAMEAATLQTSIGPYPCGRPHLRPASVQGRREDVLSLPARDGGRVSVHPIQLRAPLLRIPAVRQFQVGPRPTELLVRLVLREATAAGEVLRWARLRSRQSSIGGRGRRNPDHRGGR